jgi:kanosamine-6-phosphate phosphatase
LQETTHIASLPIVTQARTIAFCDLDGTYLAHQAGSAEKRDLRALENHLAKYCLPERMLFGWVTGSAWQEVVRKANSYGLKIWPHFVAAGLGTELYYIAENGKIIKDEHWSSLLRCNGFSRKKAEKAVSELKRDNINLTLQHEIHQTGLKFACYYAAENSGSDNQKLETIRVIAGKYSLSVKISRCGQGVGDPADSYDVDFIPLGAGKAEIVRYLLEKYGLTPEQALAFGDSSNDLEVLNMVEHGYLVSNADQVAKQAFGNTAPLPYAAGVRWGLTKHAEKRDEPLT